MAPQMCELRRAAASLEESDLQVMVPRCGGVASYTDLKVCIDVFITQGGALEPFCMPHLEDS